MIREEWLKSMTTESGCGPNLEYDPEFLQLVRKSQGTPERQSWSEGGAPTPPEPPDWRAVMAEGTALLDRSRDLRIVQLLTRALTNTKGLEGLREGLTLCRDLLEQFWDTVHPQLDFEGEPDPVLRINAVTAYADAEGLVSDVRGARFFDSKLGAISVRDVERLLTLTGGPRPDFTADQLKSALRDCLATEAQLVQPIAESLDTVDRIRAIFVERLGPTQAPDVSRLRNLLKMLVDFAATAAPAPEAPGATDAGSAAAISTAAAASPPVRAVAGVGDIRTREDAVQVLERVCEFLAVNEPSNPAPLLIRRAQRIMTMPFLDIIRELAPDALGTVENVAGIKHPEES